MTKDEAISFLQKLIDSNSDLYQEERETIAEVIKLIDRDLQLYIPVIEYREMYESSSPLPVLCDHVPTVEEVTKAWDIKYLGDEDTEQYIDPDIEPAEVKIIRSYE